MTQRKSKTKKNIRTGQTLSTWYFIARGQAATMAVLPEHRTAYKGTLKSTELPSQYAFHYSHLHTALNRFLVIAKMTCGANIDILLTFSASHDVYRRHWDRVLDTPWYWRSQGVKNTELQWLYSKTCPKRPSLGAHKSSLCKQASGPYLKVAYIDDTKVTRTMTGWDWKKKKNLMMIGNVQKSRNWGEFFSASAILGSPLNSGWEHPVKKTDADRHTAILRRDNRSMVHQKAGRRSHKAGGRYSQCSFCMKLSVREKAVAGSRWSLFTVVGTARFYWTKLGHTKPTAPYPFLTQLVRSIYDTNWASVPFCAKWWQSLYGTFPWFSHAHSSHKHQTKEYIQRQ